MNDEISGFRLERFELLNWGTFHEKVWSIAPKGMSSLMTGDIGSGKSTMVDGLTTLLVPRPSNQIVFNKAAGAHAQERSLASYVRGEYKKDVDDVASRAKSVALRDETSSSALLAWFWNAKLEKGVCIAQVFWFRDRGGQPERLFVVSEQDLTIRECLQGFEELTKLRAHLKARGARICDGLKDYAAQFRRLMGIKSDKALDLFYQTVSMKSVTDLTQFVRDHMLSGSDASERVDQLCRGFEDLDRAHQAVVRARTQISELAPLVSNGLRYVELSNRERAVRERKDVLYGWEALRQLELERIRESELGRSLERLEQRVGGAKRDVEQLRAREEGIRQAILENGGGRINEIERELSRLSEELVRRRRAEKEYREGLEQVDLSFPENIDEFSRQQSLLETTLLETAAEERGLDNDLVERGVEFKIACGKVEALEAEIRSLEGRPSNIPRRLVSMRAALCEAVGIPRTDLLPFAGELIQVRTQESEWEGAIERVLHNFALSLLVEERYYADVFRWVDENQLRERIVYYKVGQPHKRGNPGLLQATSLVRKLDLNERAPSYEWLFAHLLERFDYECCDEIENFQRMRRAVTRQGQTKGGNERHEKDDRHDIHDRSRYVLGWENKRKLEALGRDLIARKSIAHQLATEIEAIKERRQAIKLRRDTIISLLKVRLFDEIQAEPVAAFIEALSSEKTLIEQGSKRLMELKSELSTVTDTRREREDKFEEVLKERSSCASALETCRENQAMREQVLCSIEDRLKTLHFPELDEFYRGMFSDAATLKNVVTRVQEMRKGLQAEIDAMEKRIHRLRDDVVKAMRDYRHNYPADTVEIDDSIEALGEYQAMLRTLEDDGLPRFEARFKQELNEKTIQSVVQFRNQLERSRLDITERLEQINGSLRAIDYNEGTFIELKAKAVGDHDIRQFQQDMRGCLEGVIGEELYDETRFLKVKALIERFRGREGSIEIDKRWRSKVTDVRNWFEFAASELWRADGSVKEYYESGAGKSGGQKEKLAYTVLASALVFQFGIGHEDAARSFRFVVIDEAFGRGSDESTRYGLELFEKLGLQLLVVTPLQKIRVIEDYVRNVHFVDNIDGKCSKMRNMTIEEYRDIRARIENTREESLEDALKLLDSAA